MCDPATAITSVLTIASIGSSMAQSAMASRQQEQVAQQQQQYELTMAKQQAAYQQEVVNASVANYNQQVAAIKTQQQQQQTQNNQEIANSYKAARSAASTTAVSAGESGVSGLSVDALMNDFYRQRDNYVEAIKQTQDGQIIQANSEMRSAQAQGASQINSVPGYVGAPIQHSSGMATTLGVLSSGLAAYNASPYAQNNVSPFTIRKRGTRPAIPLGPQVNINPSF